MSCSDVSKLANIALASELFNTAALFNQALTLWIDVFAMYLHLRKVVVEEEVAIVRQHYPRQKSRATQQVYCI